MEFREYTLDDYIQWMDQGQYFTAGKFGDGELFCIFKALGWMDQGLHGTANADHTPYTKELGMALHETFLNEKGYYKICMPHWASSERDSGDLMQRYVQEFDIDPPNLHSAKTIFYADAEYGRLGPLKEQLEKMNFIMVSEPRKRRIPVKYVDFIETSPNNAFTQRERIEEQMLEAVEKFDDVVFGMSTGMATLVFQDDLYEQIGDRCWMISFGSIWDPYCGLRTRSYHDRYKTREL